MGVTPGHEIEVILDNSNPTVEKDSIQGIFVGWEQLQYMKYLVIRMAEFGNLTYIQERAIKVIHIYPPGPVTGKATAEEKAYGPK